ncbi:MAG: Mut7-C RNAse domain-containing protein [Desulfatiglandaceae bacterium]
MPKVVLRFYEELNDFLPPWRRKHAFEMEFVGERSVKDMTESLGVPHTEIDLILANGKSVGFDYILEDGDYISVYPVFEHLNLRNVTRLRETPLRETRFIADVNLKHIVEYMKLLGFDVYFDPSLCAKEILSISRSENRIILTKSRKLLKLKDVTHAIFIREGPVEEEVKRIIDYLDIKDRIKPFSRCLICNSFLI